ncbi:hypothetical protein [Brasilonema sp. UFV-L1]|uniref:hypothetical protein n=1 Tax=Brasilonema sp. UFV-L1 TaxID=2234130 RepID=UPI00145CAFC9|nr:hypothetical protein [Brasilonema sp. UFV-L1]NMG10414.1 hypothetical protein [Brasilonema sp. UFV-L1]
MYLETRSARNTQSLLQAPKFIYEVLTFDFLPYGFDFPVGVAALKGLGADLPTLQAQLNAWSTQRNHLHTTINWHFTTTEARIKLKRLYPVIDD